MPSYNQARFIAEAVESCLCQDDPDWELWILDNSSDQTPEVMRAYTDPRIHFIHEPRRMDPGTCLNEMLARAEGEHFSYVHTDNRLLPSYVRKFRGALSGHSLALAHCDYFEVNEEGRNPRLRRRPAEFGLPRLFSSDSLGVPFAATTALAKRVGGFSSDDLADDVFFTMRADGQGPRIHVSEPLVEYRIHSQSRTELSGVHAVARSVYRSALKAYSVRNPSLQDPYEGMDNPIHGHVASASRMAMVLAKTLLSQVPVETVVWIDGTAPASFWLAWACGMLGRPPAGFRDQREGRMLGLPVKPVSQALKEGEVCLRARRKGVDPASLRQPWNMPVRWLLRGLPPQDHAIKRYPHPILSSLMIPYHWQPQGPGPIWIRGGGPLAAYLAFGVETIAAEQVAGWVATEPVGFGLATVKSAPADARVWVLPGHPGEGISRRLRGTVQKG